MIPVVLVDELAGLIVKATDFYRYDDSQSEKKAITVYKQHIPERNIENEEFYPLIIVNTPLVEDIESETSTADITLVFGTYGEDECYAWRDLLNLMEHVRQAILKQRTIAKKFRLVFPTKWETLASQPCPFWIGYGTLKYTIGQPQEEPSNDNFNQIVWEKDVKQI